MKWQGILTISLSSYSSAYLLLTAFGHHRIDDRLCLLFFVGIDEAILNSLFLVLIFLFCLFRFIIILLLASCCPHLASTSDPQAFGRHAGGWCRWWCQPQAQATLCCAALSKSFPSSPSLIKNCFTASSLSAIGTSGKLKAPKNAAALYTAPSFCALLMIGNTSA